MPSLIDPVAYQRGVWRNAPIMEHLFDPNIAVLLDEQWQSYDAEATVGNWVLTQATTGTATKDTVNPGVLLIDSDSTTDNQGVQIQRVKSAFVPTANKSIWAEFPIKVVDTFDKVQLFVGLAEIDTTVLASGALSTSNHIGWHCLTDNGVLLFDSEKATAALQRAAATIAEDTWIRLGFYYDGVADTIQQFINGVATGAVIPTANIPKVALYPTFVCISAGTNDPILHARPFRIYQLR